MKFINDWLAEVLAALVAGVSAVLYTTVQRVTVMEALKEKHDKEFDQQCKDLEILSQRVDKHDVLMAGLDGLRADIRDIMPDVKQVVRFADKLEIILETTNRRLELLEDEMLGKRVQKT